MFGSSGCIGSNVVSFFSSPRLKNQWEVVPVPRADCDLSLPGSASTIAEFWDAESVVIPLSFVTRWKTALRENERDSSLEENRRISENLARALQLSPPAHCVYVSTSGVYGLDTSKQFVSEEGERTATDNYGIAKIEAEDSLMNAAIRFPLSILRLAIAYGCGNELTSYQPRGFAETAMRGDPIQLWGDGTELRDFIHVADLLRVVKQVIESRFEGVVNVGSGHPSSYASIVRLIQASLPGVSVEHRERTRPKVDLTYDQARLSHLMGKDYSFVKPEDFVSSFLKAPPGK